MYCRCVGIQKDQQANTLVRKRKENVFNVKFGKPSEER
jgi:hypothetical protein